MCTKAPARRTRCTPRPTSCSTGRSRPDATASADAAVEVLPSAAVEVVRSELCDVRAAEQHHRTLQLARQDLDRARHTRLAASCKSVQEGPPDQAAPCAQRQRLDDVRAAADATVDENFRLAIHRLNNRRQSVDAGNALVELSPAMVGNDDAAGTQLCDAPRILR